MDIAPRHLAPGKGDGMAVRLTGALLGFVLALTATDVGAQSSQKFSSYRSESEAARVCGGAGVWVDIERKTYLAGGQRGYNNPRRNGTFMCRQNAESSGFAASNVPNQLTCRRYGQPLVPYTERRC